VVVPLVQSIFSLSYNAKMSALPAFQVQWQKVSLAACMNTTSCTLYHKGCSWLTCELNFTAGAYWPNFKKLFTSLPTLFSTAHAAIQIAGHEAAALVAEGSSNTLFLPTDAGFKQAGVSLAAPAADIAALLK
jgi:hypothetical protein